MARPPIPKDPLFDLLYQEHYYLRHQAADPNSECVIWNGPKHRQGYGMIGAWRVDCGTKIMTTTHRVEARRKFQRALDSDECVFHTCSNPACVNPDHIEIGDRFDIHRVMKQNNRYGSHGRKKGSKNVKKSV